MNTSLGLGLRTVIMVATLLGLPAVAAWGPVGFSEWLPSGWQRWTDELRRIIVIPSADRLPPQPPAQQVAEAPPQPSAPVTQMRPSEPAPDQDIDSLRRRLEFLGAHSYRLTTWGDSGDEYRCVSRFPVDGNRLLCRQFEATGQDPVQALQRLVDQVTAWQRGVN